MRSQFDSRNTGQNTPRQISDYTHKTGIITAGTTPKGVQQDFELTLPADMPFRSIYFTAVTSGGAAGGFIRGKVQFCMNNTPVLELPWQSWKNGGTASQNRLFLGSPVSITVGPNVVITAAADSMQFGVLTSLDMWIPPFKTCAIANKARLTFDEEFSTDAYQVAFGILSEAIR